MHTFVLYALLLLKLHSITNLNYNETNSIYINPITNSIRL